MKISFQWLVASLFMTGFLNAQQPPSNSYQPSQNNYVPFTPTVVGGLPPNASGLEQPVYIADRSTDPSARNFSADFVPEIQKPTLDEMQAFEPARVVAVVGEDRVLVGDLIPPGKVTKELVQSGQYEQILRQNLVELVTRKALAQRFINDKVAGKTLKERETARRTIENQTNKIFYEKALPLMMQDMKCDTETEFVQKLDKMGKSLASYKKEFAETTWAKEHLRESVKEKPIIDLSELNDYYNENIESFRRPAKVRFQVLSAMISKYPSKAAANQAIVDMGNEVRFGGSRFDGVAKRSSSGLNASEGGMVDWTSQGALKSTVLDQAIFSLPVGGLSPILEDQDGFHIVEVIERTPAHTQSFVDSQAEIRKTLTKQKISKAQKDFIKKVRSETPVYTQWPSDIPNSQDIELTHP